MNTGAAVPHTQKDHGEAAKALLSSQTGKKNKQLNTNGTN